MHHLRDPPPPPTESSRRSQQSTCRSCSVYQRAHIPKCKNGFLGRPFPQSCIKPDQWGSKDASLRVNSRIEGQGVGRGDGRLHRWACTFERPASLAQAGYGPPNGGGGDRLPERLLESLAVLF